jgi:hypothetical protein
MNSSLDFVRSIMKLDLAHWGPATTLVVALALLVALVGGVVVIINPATLDFQHYVDTLSKAIVGAGALAVGRGIAMHGRGDPEPDIDTEGEATRVPSSEHVNLA